MNTIKAKLVRGDGEYHVAACGAVLKVGGEKGQMLRGLNVPTQDIILGVRPEHMVLAADDDANAIACTLEVNEMMGSEYHLHVNTEDGCSLIVRIPTITLTPAQREALVPGARLKVTCEGKVMHFFDTESEVNILYPCKAPIKKAGGESYGI